jgi:hypothetical protein
MRTEQFGVAGRGELQMVLHEVLPLDQAVLAHQKMEAGEVFGWIVLVPSGWVSSLPGEVPARSWHDRDACGQ